MDIKFSAEDIAFRDEVRAFFVKEYDATVAEQLSGSAGTDYKSAIVSWQKKLHSKGWIAPGWPKEYGVLAGQARKNLSTKQNEA